MKDDLKERFKRLALLWKYRRPRDLPVPRGPRRGMPTKWSKVSTKGCLLKHQLLRQSGKDLIPWIAPLHDRLYFLHTR